MDHTLINQGTVLTFHNRIQTISWAPYGGGLRDNIRAVVNWSIVEGEEKCLQDQYDDIFKCTTLVPEKTVVLLTSVPARYVRRGYASDSRTNLSVHTVTTAGLGNRRAFSDPAEWNEEVECDVSERVGTINLVVAVNRQLSIEARIELLAMIAQVKTHIVEAYQLQSPLSGAIASATGTDCIVLCSLQEHETMLMYAGMHTTLREVAARAVTQALSRAIGYWVGHHILDSL